MKLFQILTLITHLLKFSSSQSTSLSSDLTIQDLTLTVEDALTANPDNYFCKTFPPVTQDTYIHKIEAFPGTTRKNIHHIILNIHEKPELDHLFKLNSNTPPTFGDTYNCKHQYDHDHSKENYVYYAWAMDADPLVLPWNSSFLVKKGFSMQIEVHFLKRPEVSQNLTPGLRIHSLKPGTKPEFLVGTYLLVGMGFEITPFTGNYPVDIKTKAPRDLKIFAARVHAHQWSKTSTAYVFDKQTNQPRMLIQGMPHWTQEFYNRIPEPAMIRKGETVVGRCVFNNNLPQTIIVGANAKDEMCNFYFLYIEKLEVFQPIDVVVGRNSKLGSMLPNKSYGVPDFAGFSGETAKQLGRAEIPKPEFLINIGMAMDHEAEMRHEEMQNDPTKRDYFFQGEKLKGSSSVALDAKGNYLFVFHRGGRVFDQNTFDWHANPNTNDKIISEWTTIYTGNPNFITNSTIKVLDAYTGQEIYDFGALQFLMPHGIYIDEKNQYLYVTDVGQHKVFRLKIDNLGRYVQEDQPTFQFFGNANLNWEKVGDGNFCMPTDVAVKHGKIYVSDGYWVVV